MRARKKGRAGICARDGAGSVGDSRVIIAWRQARTLQRRTSSKESLYSRHDDARVSVKIISNARLIVDGQLSLIKTIVFLSFSPEF